MSQTPVNPFVYILGIDFRESKPGVTLLLCIFQGLISVSQAPV